ncbi:MAG: bifunctional lysylphosphatidylglycerol flippase/synthetase MprF [Acidimicrobiales bacterium]
MPDLLRLEVPVGGRVLVAANLSLGTEMPAGCASTIAELAQAIDAWNGPGVLIFNGNLIDAGTDASAALGGQQRLVEAVRSFAASPGRRVVVLPGDRDASLGWDAGAQQEVRDRLHAELAFALELKAHTGRGERLVHVEPGQQLDTLARREDPRHAGERPLVDHLRLEIFPAVRAHHAGQRERPPAWLDGMDRLDDAAAFPHYLASRLAYRKLARGAWLLLVPVAVALALRLPTLAIDRARNDMSARVALLGAAAVVELVLLAALAVAAVRGAWRALAGFTIAEDRRDPNGAGRALGRELVTSGHAGVITAHTSRPELVQLGSGFYANPGAVGEVVAEVASRLPSLGAPAVFLSHLQVAWLELEAGAELHVRLFHVRSDLPGATLLERLVARRSAGSTNTKALHPAVVATFPQGRSWPAETSRLTAHRRVRRAAGLFVAAAGFASLVSSVSEPLRDRLATLRDVFPIVVPEAAAALAALAGVTLLVLARGIRRVQRRAWLVTEILLIVAAVLHLIKGVGVEEAGVALAVAGFLWVNRGAFQAATDLPQIRGGVLTVVFAAGATVLAGAVGLEVSGWVQEIRQGPVVRRLSWVQAVQATAERMVGVRHVALPHRLDEFFSPAIATATVGLALALLALAFRPVVRRQRSRPGWPAARKAPAAGATPAALAGPAALARARRIVGLYGAGTLDYFALRADKEFFFWGDTVVAHAVHGGVCLVSPDPIGPEAEREEAWRQFRRYVDQHGWALGGLGVAEEWLPIYRAGGMHDLYVGDEAVVRVERFSLEGGRFKGLRQAVNRVAKYGYTISFHDPAGLDPALRAALLEVMTKSRRGDVERGFSMTLGRAFDPSDKGLLLAVVHGPAGVGESAVAGAPVAFCQYVPAPGIGGFSLDLMRRDNGEHPNGLMDFAVVETIRYLKGHAYEGLGLNFATMRAVLAGEAGDGLSHRIQAWLLRRMGDSMQIESLWKFNAKFDPDWQPRYAIYDAPEHALATALAVARAESFWELPLVGRFLVPSVD